ncbi:unnamed protein product [Urochloa decumbens]|uniref:FAD-binding domain-containing protein n=1 Tax=Urochloa decumbens TaxID=240449 RepID=A0ABC8ZZZ7_9POAL
MEEEVHGIVIVGAGICGLATALALHRIHDVLQHEQGNKSVVVPVRGELRWLKRKDLIETMANNIPPGAIRFSCHVTAIHPANPGNQGAVLTTLDDTIVRAKALIGCDGSNSMVAKYLGLSPSKPAPCMLLRGLTRYPHGHPLGTSIWHPSVDATKDVHTMKDFVLEKLKDHCSEDIIEMVRDPDPESLILLTKIWYRPPWQVMFSSFQKGTTTVAGDAMHVMGFYIGQGGSAALEDSIVLARSLSRAAAGSGGRELCEKKISAAMGEYVRERRMRLVRLSLESFALRTMLATKSLLIKLACFATVAVLGTKSNKHANYDCGRL